MILSYQSVEEVETTITFTKTFLNLSTTGLPFLIAHNVPVLSKMRVIKVGNGCSFVLTTHVDSVALF